MPKSPTTLLSSKGIRTDYGYIDWINTSLNSPEPLKYFDFADLCGLPQHITNLHYSSIVQQLTGCQSRKIEKLAKEASRKFKTRNDPSASFGQEYNRYWESRSLQDLEISIQQRRQETVRRLNDDTCNALESLSNELRSSSSPAKQSSASHKRTRSVAESIETVTDHVKKTVNNQLGMIGVLNWDMEFVREILKEQLSIPDFESLMTSMELPTIHMGHHCRVRLVGLKNCAPSATRLRKEMRKDVLGDLDFDMAVHSDLYFVEKTISHFLDFIQSPRNPLLLKNTERTTAINTTIHVLNTLFLPHNDVIDLDWVEKQSFETQSRKWDGVAFTPTKDRLTVALIEFSGGVQQVGSKKVEKDTMKIYTNLLQMLQSAKKDTENTPTRLFCVRFADLHLYFESLTYHSGAFLKATHAEILCPTSCSQILSYANKIDRLFHWKQAVLSQALKMVE